MRVKSMVVMLLLCLVPGSGWAQERTTLSEAVRLEAARAARLLPASPRQGGPVARSWRSEHPVLFGALVGAGAGALVMGLEAKASLRSSPEYFALLGGGLGGGVGALVGWSVSR